MKLVKLALVVGALAAVWAFVPIGGRTLSERWRAAGSLERFATGSWAELRGKPAPDAPAEPPPPARAPSRSQARTRATREARPSEAHTDADRRALDRIVADHLRN